MCTGADEGPSPANEGPQRAGALTIARLPRGTKSELSEHCLTDGVMPLNTMTPTPTTPSLLAVANRLALQLGELPEGERRKAWEHFALRWVTFWRKRGASEAAIDQSLSVIRRCLSACRGARRPDG
jgi:hypothetical protein